MKYLYASEDNQYILFRQRDPLWEAIFSFDDSPAPKIYGLCKYNKELSEYFIFFSGSLDACIDVLKNKKVLTDEASSELIMKERDDGNI